MTVPVVNEIMLASFLPQASKLGNAGFVSPTGFLSHQVNGGQFLTNKNFVGFPDMMGVVQAEGTPGANGQSAQVLLLVHDVLRFRLSVVHDVLRFRLLVVHDDLSEVQATSSA